MERARSVGRGDLDRLALRYQAFRGGARRSFPAPLRLQQGGRRSIRRSLRGVLRDARGGEALGLRSRPRRGRAVRMGQRRRRGHARLRRDPERSRRSLTGGAPQAVRARTASPREPPRSHVARSRSARCRKDRAPDWSC